LTVAQLESLNEVAASVEAVPAGFNANFQLEEIVADVPGLTGTANALPTAAVFICPVIAAVVCPVAGVLCCPVAAALTGVFTVAPTDVFARTFTGVATGATTGAVTGAVTGIFGGGVTGRVVFRTPAWSPAGLYRPSNTSWIGRSATLNSSLDSSGSTAQGRLIPDLIWQARLDDILKLHRPWSNLNNTLGPPGDIPGVKAALSATSGN
jgi:hypothetical protein